jgi:hypothetical protein
MNFPITPVSVETAGGNRLPARLFIPLGLHPLPLLKCPDIHQWVINRTKKGRRNDDVALSFLYPYHLGRKAL